jgi:nucleotide-binding universal stress UspA family protein
VTTAAPPRTALDESNVLSALIVVDDSAAAPRAIVYAGDLARRDGGRLTLMWLVKPARSAGSGPFLVPIPQENEERAESNLLSLAALVPEEVPVSVRTIVTDGVPVDPVLQRAHGAQHDAIIIAVHPERNPFKGCLCCALRRRTEVPVVMFGSSGPQPECCVSGQLRRWTRHAASRWLTRLRGR